MSINVSPLQIKNSNFIDVVKALIFKTGVNTKWLNFEVTESSSMSSRHIFGEVLTELSKMGIALSIDDFGTGYSSYSYLKKFSIDYLKIDKQLIDNITKVPGDAQIIKAIIAMSKAMEIKTIAEGVETKEQMELLKIKGCDMIQGYFYGRPVSEEDFLEKHILNLDK